MLYPPEHLGIFSKQQNFIDVQGRNDDRAILRVDVDARVRLEAFETNLNQMHVNRAPLARWTQAKTVETLEKPHYQ